MRTYVCLVLLALAACKEQPVPGVCCLTNDDCARLGGIQPRGCPDGFACRNLICEAADCAAAADCPADQPVCDPAAATCARCTASSDCDGRADAPVCDPDTGGCRACALDAECASEVCDVDTGRCVPEGDVIYASATGAETATCTHAQPCSLSRAVVVATADPASSIVRLLPGTYGTGIEVLSGTVTFVGTGAKLQPQQGQIGYRLNVESGANVTVRGLTVDASLGGVGCYGVEARATLNLQDFTVLPFMQIIQVHSCTVSMRRVTMSALAGIEGYISLNNSSLDADRMLLTGVGVVAQGKQITLRITNSILDGRGIGFSPTDDASTESRMSLAFNTIYDRTSGSATSCAEPMVNATSIVENNVIVAASPLAGPDALTRACTAASNVVFPQSAPLPSSNLIADPLLVDPAGHDLRLGPGSPAIDAAVPSTTLTTDHDVFGAPRPQGARFDIGAHERVP